MAEWRERVDDLLYSGESIEETVDVDGASVVVTSHRVLAFQDGNGDGPPFQHAERPNVEGVSTGAESEMDLLERGVRYGIIGFVLVGTGLVVDFGSIVGDVNLGGQGGQRLGIGGIMGQLQALLSLLTQLDRLLRIFGALALFLSVVLVGVYWLTRDRTLVVEVAGDDDIHLPRPAEASEAAGRLERAIAPGTSEGTDDVPSGDPLSES